MDIKNIKIKFDRQLITAEEITNEIAEEDGLDKRILLFMHQRYDARKLEYLMNGVAVKELIGTNEHRLYKSRSVKGLNGEVTIIPERYKIKGNFPERFSKIYDRKDYYYLFTTDGDNDPQVVITKETPKIESGEATYLGCLKELSDALWKGQTVVIVETNKELIKLTNDLNEFISDEREDKLKKELKESDVEKLKELRTAIRILEVLKQNIISERITIIKEEK